MEQVQHVFEHVKMNEKLNPLAKQVRRIEKYLTPEAGRIKANNKFVSVVICTQGKTTDEGGQTGTAVRKDLEKSLVSLAKLPVKIVLRLCTDEEEVVDYFNALDAKLDCDVLDDFWGEAMEVYLHNPWLTYGIGLHRLREAGLATDLIDDLDEKGFSLDQIHKFCTEIFLSDISAKRGNSLPHPRKDWTAFMDRLEQLMKREKLQWNPVKNRQTPWIDLRKLDSLYGRSKKHSDSPPRQRPARHAIHRGRQASDTDSFGAKDEFYHQHGTTSVHSAHREQHHTVHEHSCDPPGHGESHDSRPRRETSNAHARRASDTDAFNATHEYHRTTSSTSSSASTSAPSSPPQPPASSRPTRYSPPAMTPPADLTEVLQRWSHQAPSYRALNSLQQLLVTVPTLFPPQNQYVEKHEYYSKWKEFSEDAFNDESGDELNELLKRAVRKAKFFLHPDKIPKELSENQTLLFKTVWDVLMESESVTLGD
jgi:hypothetical protein